MKVHEIRALFTRAVRALMPDADISDHNPLMQYVHAVSAVAAGVYHRLGLIQRDSVPSTATLDGAIIWGRALKVPRKGPTQAHGKAVLQVHGTPGKTVVHGTRLRSQTSRVVVLVQNHHVIDADGLALVDVRTEDRGASANLAAGTTLRFESKSDGVRETAKLIRSLQGGFDHEPGGTYQERVARRLAEPPQGGNVGDYRRWIEEALPDTLVTGYPLPIRSGRGTVDVVGLRHAHGLERILGQAERDAILAYITPRKLATDQVRVVETIPRIVDIEIGITPVSEPRYQFDFDDRGGLDIASWNPVTRELVFVESLPPDVAPNKRIGLRMTHGGVRGNTGAQQLIAAMTGPDRLVLVEHPDRQIPDDLGEGDTVFAGGSLVERARRAILDGYTVHHDDSYDRQGGHIAGIDELGPANPNTRYGNWLDRIEPSRLEAAARGQAGVDNAVCLTPSGTVKALDIAAEGLPPPDATLTIDVLIAGQVIVRHKP